MQTSIVQHDLTELAITEILLGMFLNLPSGTFREDNLYQFLKQTGEQRFRIGRAGNIQGVRFALSFFEMGRMIYEVGGEYHFRNTMRDSVEKELRGRDVLPRYAPVFAKLAKQFVGRTF